MQGAQYDNKPQGSLISLHSVDRCCKRSKDARKIVWKDSSGNDGSCNMYSPAFLSAVELQVLKVFRLKIQLCSIPEV